MVVVTFWLLCCCCLQLSPGLRRERSCGTCTPTCTHRETQCVFVSSPVRLCLYPTKQSSSTVTGHSITGLQLLYSLARFIGEDPESLEHVVLDVGGVASRHSDREAVARGCSDRIQPKQQSPTARSTVHKKTAEHGEGRGRGGGRTRRGDSHCTLSGPACTAVTFSCSVRAKPSSDGGGRHPCRNSFASAHV